MDLMPTIFFGHGNPLNALSKNLYTNGWASVSRSIPTPKAILSLSAHYYIPFSMVTSNQMPPTIHDFYGFPDELYRIRYPAPGSIELAHRVDELLDGVNIRFDDKWGFDHGTWSVLKHVFPEANIPVVQLSIDETQPPIYHYELGNKLKPLRKENVLIIGSGNVVHNLALYNRRNDTPPFEWAERFDNYVREMLINGNHEALINYQHFGRDAILSVPTPDHYLPLMYIIGLQHDNENISFPVQGIDGCSISMLSIKIG